MPDVTPKTESGRARDVLLRVMQDESIYGRKRQRIEDAADGMAREAASKAVAEVLDRLAPMVRLADQMANEAQYHELRLVEVSRELFVDQIVRPLALIASERKP